MPFNNELLVREVATFPVPVVAGIGHDKDAPLVALAADFSESTPTACANLLNESWEQLLLFLERCERNVIARYEAIFDRYLMMENKLKIFFERFKALLGAVGQILERAEKVVFLNNPERQLRLGYSIASIDGKIIRQTKDVDIGKMIDILVRDGKIMSEVKKII